MNTKLRIVTPLSMTLQALGFLGLGIIELYAPQLIDRFIYRVLLIGLTANAVLNILSFVFVRTKRLRRTLVTGLLSALACAAIRAFPRLLGGGAGVAFGLWAVINSVIRGGYAIQLKCSGERGWLRCMVEGLVILSFGLALITSPLTNLPRINWVLGVYLIFLSITLAGDAIREFFKWDIDGSHFRRRIRIALPVVLTAFLPTQAAEAINRALETEQLEQLRQINGPEGVSDGALEVFFHMGKDVAMGFGHVDFCLHDVSYSYGCYDGESNRLMNLLSDGVLAVSPRDEYLKFATEIEKKILVGFTLYLTGNQEKKLKEGIDRVISMSKPWIPREIPEADIVPFTPQDLALRSGTRFFKLQKGKYRTYNTFRTNCVALAEMLVGETGLPIMQSNGIITPGTYYAYMNREFARKNSMVVKRTVYRAS